ncbi:Uncharacterised protein [Serratia quinivorans]|nr:Uncharacterised protein [Serratia quinivorans]
MNDKKTRDPRDREAPQQPKNPEPNPNNGDVEKRHTDSVRPVRPSQK